MIKHLSVTVAVKMGRIPKVDKERALEAHRAVEHGERRGISTGIHRKLSPILYYAVKMCVLLLHWCRP